VYGYERQFYKEIAYFCRFQRRVSDGTIRRNEITSFIVNNGLFPTMIGRNEESRQILQTSPIGGLSLQDVGGFIRIA
jgi:hypothetical protein